MIDRGRAAWRLAVLGLAGLGAGCAAPQARLTLTSHKDPYFPERARVELTHCVYQADSSGDLHIVAHNDAAAGGPARYLYAHVFWRPRPGRTYSDPSSSNATLQYVVSGEAGTTAYAGTAFVYLKPGELTERLNARIESGRLELSTLLGSPDEPLGNAGVTGRLRATRSDPQVAELRRRLATLVGQEPAPAAATNRAPKAPSAGGT